MCKKNKIMIWLSAILFAIFVGFTIIVKFVSTSSIGPNESTIGLANFNSKIFKAFGQSALWDKISDVCLIFAIFLALIIAIVGLIQLIKRKSIKKIDKEIICFGILLVLMAIAYLFFEIVPINFRPVLINVELETSFPSTHTLIVLCICSASIIISKHFISNKILKILFNTFCTLIMAITIVARLLSGMHWATDIVGGILLSAFLISIFSIFLTNKLTRNKPNNFE